MPQDKKILKIIFLNLFSTFFLKFKFHLKMFFKKIPNFLFYFLICTFSSYINDEGGV